MLKRKFKQTDLAVSVLGLGCMRLPRTNPEKADIDYARAQEMVDYAYSHGVNYFDTAFMYHDGMSEEFLGHALKKYDRSSVLIATKMPIWMAKTPEDIEKIFNLQLKHLQTDYIDFYLFHSMTKSHFEKCIDFGLYEFLLKKKQEGVVRHIGFSFHDVPAVLEEIAATYPWDFAQLQLNYLDWEMQDAKSQYEILERYNIPCIVMEPVRGGALSSPCEAANELFLTARPDISIASWAIRYVATLPNVLTVLSGMSNMEQLKDNINTLTNFMPLTKEDYTVINKAVEAYKSKDMIPCTGCRYCMDCPSGVDIPKMFDLYNHYSSANDKNGYITAYNEAEPAIRAQNCIACGICEGNCPQAIYISKKLKMICELTKS